jgi:hypothetical protein
MRQIARKRLSAAILLYPAGIKATGARSNFLSSGAGQALRNVT